MTDETTPIETPPVVTPMLAAQKATLGKIVSLADDAQRFYNSAAPLASAAQALLAGVTDEQYARSVDLVTGNDVANVIALVAGFQSLLTANNGAAMQSLIKVAANVGNVR